jgi:outer membrane beta-barrel protein
VENRSEIRLYLPRHTSTFLLLLLLPIGAMAQSQEAPGIDLSRPSGATTAPAQKAPAGPGGRAGQPAASPEAPIAPGESDVALDDRVKAVQRKGFLKRHRFELGLDLPVTLNDAFYEKLGIGGKLAYNFDDSFAVAARGAYYWPLRTDAVREGNRAFGSQLLSSQVYGQLMADGIWSPVYGKVAWLGSQIVHFDMYLLAGFGGVWSATSVAPRSEGPHMATDFGGGIRFYPKSWLALDAGLVATLYVDQPNKAIPSAIQKIVAAQIGVAMFWPFTFEYVYP